MKSILALALFLGLFGVGSVASADEGLGDHHEYRWAKCVGGPAKPSYAFSDWNSASICQDAVARQSRDCARFVRQAPCHALAYSINTVSPYSCVCNGGGYGVGHW